MPCANHAAWLTRDVRGGRLPDREPPNTSHSAPTSIGSPSDVPVPCISSAPTSAALLRARAYNKAHQQRLRMPVSHWAG